MIGANDRITLAPAVTLRGAELVDGVRGVSITLNRSAMVALREPTPARMAAALVATFSVTHDRADADARALCNALNRLLLANVEVQPAQSAFRWLRAALVVAPLRQLPAWPARRRAVSTETVTKALRTVVRGLVGAATAVAFAIALPLLAIGIPRAAIAAGAAAALGLIAHELGHALALRGVATALIVRGVRVSLLHAKLNRRREAVVAAAGPLAVVVLAVVTLAFVSVTNEPSAVAVPLTLALHAFGLTVVAPDGRKICAVC